MFAQIKKFGSLVLVSSLIACGGGSGGSSSPSGPVVSNETFQVKTAYNNSLLDTGTTSFRASGNYVTGGNTYPVTGSGSTTLGALTSSSFQGTPGYSKTSVITGSVTINGQTRPLASTSTQYVDLNYNPLGNSGDEFTEVTTSNPVPVTAKVNDTGNWYQANRYTNSSKNTLLGTRSVSFALLPDTATTAILTIITIDKNTQGTTTSTYTTKSRITPAGVMTRLSEQGVENTTNPTGVLTLDISF